MPRSELNNPSVRMGNVLSDYYELEAIYDQTMQVIAVWLETGLITQEEFEQLPPKPRAIAVAEERVRRETTGGKVIYKRNYMRRMRASTLEATVVRDLTAEEEAAIMREVIIAADRGGG